MKRLKCLYALSTTICFSYAALDNASCPKILSYAQNQLSHRGVLQTCESFVYVNIDDEYIHKLIKFIKKEGFEEPPYFGDSNLVGAHITAIYPDEVKKYGITKVPECGRVIDFTPKECQVVVKPPTWQEVDALYLVVVEAPELDAIRRKYELPHRKYDYHITIGVKPKTIKTAVG